MVIIKFNKFLPYFFILSLKFYVHFIFIVNFNLK